MALTKTPVCEFNKPAVDFHLLGVDGNFYDLKTCTKENGVVVAFICNHCPFVKAILPRLLADVELLAQKDIGFVAISANDPTDYPEDSYPNMQKLAKNMGFSFPYLFDETQAIAKKYGAVCTPDFFGYNADLKLQYRGRLDEGGMNTPPLTAKRELVEAMAQIAKTGKGPEDQIASQGCSIKWR